MSDDEQDQILGRLIRQRNESRRTLAALQTKLEEVAANLSRIAKSIESLWQPGRIAPDAFAREALEALPDKEGLLEALKEFRDEKQKLAEIEARIERFG
jgi:hypothetical protein